MAKINFSTVCPCGAPLSGRIKKPTLLENPIAKMTCKCGTRVMIQLIRNKTQANGRTFKTDLEILELSQAAEDKIKANPIFQAKRALLKAANAVGFEQGPDKTVIETEMD